MNIVGRYLACEDIVLGLDVSGKIQALEEIALLLERRHHVEHETVLRALWRREQIGSTALGHGVAIPHARIAGISQPILLLARTKLPIKFGTPDHQPVSVLFVIIVPEHATEEHLQILATVSEMFASESFRSQMEIAAEAETMQRLFRDWNGDIG